MKFRSIKVTRQQQPFLLFLSGDSRCRKFHLSKPIFHSSNKLILYQGGDPNKTRISVLTSAGGAAVNIDSPTIHSRLFIYYL